MTLSVRASTACVAISYVQEEHSIVSQHPPERRRDGADMADVTGGARRFTPGPRLAVMQRFEAEVATPGSTKRAGGARLSML